MKEQAQGNRPTPPTSGVRASCTQAVNMQVGAAASDSRSEVNRRASVRSTPRLSLLGAHVEGAAALWLVRRVGSDAPNTVRYFREIGRSDVAAQIEEAVGQLRQVAMLWRLAEDEGRTTGSGNAELPEVPDQAESRVKAVDVFLGTAEAAGRLGVSERRVRQLLQGGRLAGRKEAGRWFISTESIAELSVRQELDT